MHKIYFFLSFLCVIFISSCNVNNKGVEEITGAEDREYCIKLLLKIADPVLTAVNNECLDKTLPRREWEIMNKRCDIRTTTLQAVGRTISGLSPWLSLGIDDTEEGQLRKKYIELSRKALVNIVNPQSEDFLFDKENETYERIVHCAYLAYPLLVAQKELWDPLTQNQKDLIINALKTHRSYKPFECNWLLFASIIEAAIWKFTGDCDMEKLEYGVTRHMEFYLGDGMYGDGPQFHWDYYNSYVIQPLLLEVLNVCSEKEHKFKELLPTVIGRAKRYAEIQEHLISPTGTFPIIGRSNCYRIAAFQHLEYMAFRKMLPESLKPGATRAALMAVIKNMMEAPGTFDKDGWLNAGVVGHQENARDVYSLTGAFYMCTMGLTHLGLPANDPFWTEPAGKWFQKRVWSGDDIPSQHEYYGK